MEYIINLMNPHNKQREFMECKAKRVVIRAGRRSGKTTGVAIYAVEKFLQGNRVLYAAPTTEQVSRFWTEITRALWEPVHGGVYRQNISEHVVELEGTEQRIRAKTAWNADSLRGDYASVLILDEWQLMDETAWEEVGAPMLLDNNGDAIFIYTPPSLRSRSVSKAHDPQHAAKMFKKAAADTTGRWATFHFGSGNNPYISKEALAEIAQDMTTLAYRQEILAEDVDEAPGSLWTREVIEENRRQSYPDLAVVAVGVDPTATSTGDEAGIISGGMAPDGHIYIFADDSRQGSPHEWATEAVSSYHKARADKIVAEKNNGGEMVSETLHHVDKSVPVELVWASRGKHTRAQPVAVLYSQGRVHHVGSFPILEDEMCMWVPGDDSPNRMDALVWLITELGGLSERALTTATQAAGGTRRDKAAGGRRRGTVQ